MAFCGQRVAPQVALLGQRPAPFVRLHVSHIAEAPESKSVSGSDRDQNPARLDAGAAVSGTYDGGTRVGIAAERATLLLTGATGFVGGELLRVLRAREQVRCLVRDASKLQDSDGLDTVEADLGEPDSLEPALEGVREVYYLVHSMEPGVEGGFAERDRQAAQNFCEIAGSCGVKRTIYLGGVSGSGEQSEHLSSRNEVEDILRECSDEFVALQASMIVGAGSASFGTLVQLVDRLPALLLPTWREHRVQPVAIDDVVAALVAARDVAPGSYEIVGPDVLTFEEMTEIVAELLGQDHRSLSLPFSSSKLEAAAASAVVDADRELLAAATRRTSHGPLGRKQCASSCLRRRAHPFRRCRPVRAGGNGTPRLDARLSPAARLSLAWQSKPR